MQSNINIQEYTEDRRKENISVEFNSDEQLRTLSFSSLKTNKKIFIDINDAVSTDSAEEEDNNKFYKLLYSRIINQLILKVHVEKKNKKIIKLIYENTLKEMLLKKYKKDKQLLNNKLKNYYLGYSVWKSLLLEPYENLTLIE